MAKERVKNQAPAKSENVVKIEMMLEVGNVAAARKLGAGVQSDSSVAEAERENVAQLLKGIVPEPLVFWIGVGSVAVATALAIWLVR